MIKAVMLDWAGTMVDYGCFAPLQVFIEVFAAKGIEVTSEEARIPMGLQKREHISVMCKMDRIASHWHDKYGQVPSEEDIDALYRDFEPRLFAILHQYAEPIPGAVDLTHRLRSRGIQIGSTTGYTRAMMDIVAPAAAKQGYAPDVLTAPDEVAAGRPYPWMIYRNAEVLGVYPMHHIVKAGDTVSDMLEGVNAGCWTVGVVLGSSELGLSQTDVNTMDPGQLHLLKVEVAQRLAEAGAHYIIEEIGELDRIIDEINERMTGGDRP
ncbi:phosphonoacetaldehyde hydrolase [Paenibacillus shirakamiensis]|uniref:Phosphonoacetaldehyde hydrolase n=1 Tax=Paenibacillus shirakamiensis TaxID=1265935 RepID=A0ABS4JF64_9BACL|nr:phosphonoacetaldehyde hydrolase [Paenibacillus shirakamiensis]MBP2000338.1 phosphonoacetaldehyde hydrolase [Paenibacillus shirakamiensis]